MAARADLPLVLAAVVCENVLEEKDGVLSVTRIVDRFFLERPPRGVAAGIQFRYLAVLKRGATTDDEHEASIVLRFPSQRVEVATRTPLKVRWLAGEEDSGVNINMRLAVGVAEEGLYWIDLFFDGTPVASTPFRVTYGLPTT